MMPPSFRGFVLALPLCLCSLAIADDFPVLRNSEKDTSAEPMPAREAAALIDLPNGFQATLFASEPEVQNPIAMTWDTRGRLWVAENFTYAERQQRFDLSFRDRVLVFEDSDGDGVSDSRTVFTDQVQMLTSVEVGHGGVWLMCPPQVLFIPDADQDLVPDGPAQVVLDGFEVAQANYHNYANGLRFGPDGWLYGRCGGSCPGRIGLPGTPEAQRVALEGGIWRYHPVRKTVETICAGTTNPWGHDWNEFGELFFTNTVNGHFWHATPGAHFKRPFNLDPNPQTYETIDQHADHYHFDTGKSWTASRDGAANSLGGGHAHCGGMFYLGTAWPEKYRGKFFTSNFHGRRLNQETVSRNGSGYVATHDPDFCIMGDPFYRGMDMSVGPDGGVFVIDWSDTGECHDHTGVHRTSGRIFKITHSSYPASPTLSDVASLANQELVDLHTTENEWAIRRARLVLQERNVKGVDIVEACERLRALIQGEDQRIATGALMTLLACEKTDEKAMFQLLSSPHEHVRVWAIRSLFDAMPIDDVFGPRNTVQRIDDALVSRSVEFAKSESSGLVRLALASTLQRLPIDRRCELARSLMSHGGDADDHNLPLMVWYGLMPIAEEAPDTLVEVAINSQWPTTQRLIVRRLAESMQDQLTPIEQLLGRITTIADPALRLNVLGGISDAMKGWVSTPQPANWTAFVQSIKKDEISLATTARELGVLFGDGRAIDEIRALVLDDAAEIGIRRSALIALVNQRPEDLSAVCEKLLGDQRLSGVAAKGLALEDASENANMIIKFYNRFRGTDRPAIIASLVARPSFARELVNAIGTGAIAKSELSAFDARQIRSFGDEELNRMLAEVWGETRESPQDRIDAMAKLKATLTSNHDVAADLTQGRLVYAELCGKCHRMYGEGQMIGPDLTGSNRNNLDYLIENVIDPSAVVSNDYRVSVLMMEDGRVLNGVVISQNDRTLTLQTQTEQLSIAKESVEAIKPTSQSPMPEGQLTQLTPAQIRNLFAYLQHPSQVPLP